MKPLGTPRSRRPASGHAGVTRGADQGQAAEPAAVRSTDAAPSSGPVAARPSEMLWSIGELAAQLGVTTRTIRFYETRHLITPSRDNGARVYGRRDRARMQLILRGKNLGFTLEDIREYLSLYDADPSQVAQTQLLLQKVEGSIANLESKKVDLERTLGELRALKDRAVDFLETRKSNVRS